MNIIEKLGITPGPWYAEDLKVTSKLSNMSSIETKENRYISYYPVVAWDTEEGIDIHTPQLNVILAAPEMLEALIDIRKFMDRLPHDWFSEHRALKIENAIEKATGKSWEEIKELLK